MLVDLMYMSIRQNFRLISSDSFIFLFNFRSNMSNNVLNPEKYLKTYYPEKCDEIFYRQLLKWNYIGIDISFGVLKMNLLIFLQERKITIQKLLKICNSPYIQIKYVIYTCSKFLKEIY